MILFEVAITYKIFVYSCVFFYMITVCRIIQAILGWKNSSERIYFFLIICIKLGYYFIIIYKTLMDIYLFLSK